MCWFFTRFGFSFAEGPRRRHFCITARNKEKRKARELLILSISTKHIEIIKINIRINFLHHLEVSPSIPSFRQSYRQSLFAERVCTVDQELPGDDEGELCGIANLLDINFDMITFDMFTFETIALAALLCSSVLYPSV